MNYLIIGGTGTLGREVIKRLLENGKNDVVCFSRDELKQKQVAQEFANSPNLRFVIGDMRDRGALDRAMVNVDVVYLLAALKHVDTLEENPEESVKTNILGVMNVADAAIGANVPFVVFSSTDKAVAPCNVYGMCKGIAEKILLRLNHTQHTTRFSVFRWGNVLGSRGSVIGVFAKTLITENKAYLTDPDMTRFWIRIEDAAEFMIENYYRHHAVNIPPIKAAPVKSVIAAVAKIVGATKYDIVSLGIRQGEKIHETLLPGLVSDSSAQYSELELVSLLRPIVGNS